VLDTESSKKCEAFYILLRHLSGVVGWIPCLLRHDGFASIFFTLYIHKDYHIMQNEKIILFLGHGYTASYIQSLCDAQKCGYLIASTRDNGASKIFYFNNQGHQNFNFDIADDLKQQAINSFHTPLINHDYMDYVKHYLPHVTHILISSPPYTNGDYAYHKYQDIFKNNLCKDLKWVGYLSATSVYGDIQGQKCTEDMPCHPKTIRGQMRLNAEHLWYGLYQKHQIPVHIFRLSGIYGQNRNKILDIQTGTAISIIKDHHISNRIYVRDIALAVMASMNSPTAGEIFNLSDDMPCASEIVNDYIADLLKLPRPQKVLFSEYQHKMSDMARSFYLENKYIDNFKIKKMLNFTFQYPTYKEGILDIIHNMRE
jgi:nucleoside-diphosphate-sugar epimerase